MKNYTITVNGNVYDVTVEEGASTGAAPVAAPVAQASAPADPAGPDRTDAGSRPPNREPASHRDRHRAAALCHRQAGRPAAWYRKGWTGPWCYRGWAGPSCHRDWAQRPAAWYHRGWAARAAASPRRDRSRRRGRHRAGRAASRHRGTQALPGRRGLRRRQARRHRAGRALPRYSPQTARAAAPGSPARARRPAG